MKQISLQELLEVLIPEVVLEVFNSYKTVYTDATHVVLFRNDQLDSSSCGESVVVFVGPSNTLKTVEDASKTFLNDLPSKRMYPICYAELSLDNPAWSIVSK